MKAKDKILNTADRLFYKNGIRAVGIDTIISEAGVAKATLYNHFPSKNDLIKCYLESKNIQLFENFEKDKITIAEVFQYFIETLKNSDMPHCPFISALSEFTTENDEIRDAAISYKKINFDLFKYLAEKENLKDPDIVADQLMVISNGMSIQRQVFGKNYDPNSAMELVKMVIDKHKNK